MASSDGSQAEVLQNLLEALCNNTLLQRFSEYHSFLKDFIESCMSDASTSVVLSGPGHDSLPVFKEIRDFGRQQFILRQQPVVPRLHFVHNGCGVLEDPALEYKSGVPVLLYASPAKEYDERHGNDKVVLHVSSRTYATIHKEDYGLPLKESVVVRHDKNRVPKFHLSSEKFHDLFTKTCQAQFLLFQFPAIPLDLRSFMENVLNNSVDVHDAAEPDHAGLWYESQKETVGSVIIQPAFRYTQWPPSAVAWASRPRKWPGNALVRKAMECTTYIVPHRRAKAQIQPQDTIPFEEQLEITDDLLWTFNFCEAERLLLSQLGASVKKVFFLLLGVLSRNIGSHVYTVLKSTFLWCLEEHGPELGTVTDNGKLTDKLLIVLTKLDLFLESGYLPHYFLEDTNMLTLSEDARTDLICIVRETQSNATDILLKSTGFGTLKNTLNDSHYSANALRHVREMLLANAQRSLLAAAEQNTQLVCIQLYQKLHGCGPVSRCIGLHQEVLAEMTAGEDPVHAMLIRTLQDFVHSSLGSLYVVHGLQSYFAKEKKVYFARAEEHFALVADDELLTNKVRTSFLLSKRGQHQTVVTILKPVLEKLLDRKAVEENTEKKDAVAIVSDLSFEQTLIRKATESIKVMDLLVMKIEKQLMPRDVGRNMGLAQIQFLGYTKHPVAILDTAIVCGYFLSVAYAELGQYDRASQVLQSVEDFCLKDEFDMNEKRGCVYLNVLADAYIKARNVEQGKYLLERSLAIMPNPRNPGRWALISVKTQRAREFVIGGVGVAMATAVAAVAINFLMSKK